jgi:flagellar FliL protein
VAREIDQEAEDVREAIEGRRGGKGGDAAGGGEAGSGGGKKKLILIGAVVAVLSIGGGAGAYFFLGHKAPEEAPVAAEPEIPVEANPILVSIERVTAPMTKGGDVSGYVYLSLNIEVADEETEQTVKDNMPKLRAAFATDLYGASIVDPKEPDRADVSAIQARLLKVAKQVFGDEAIKQIYVSKVSYVGG